jgi:DnaJ-class molecular chaperone
MERGSAGGGADLGIKFRMDVCSDCDGHGVHYYTESKFFGLVKTQVAYQCNKCNGTGKVRGEPYCPVCDSAGLIGNEREICRTCNGTGAGDSFRHIPRASLISGTTFNRRCDRCKAETLHEIVSDIETRAITTTWEKNELIRAKEEFERIKIECTMCGRSYHARLDKYYHSEDGLFYDREGDEEDKKPRKLFGQDFSSPGEIFK